MLKVIEHEQSLSPLQMSQKLSSRIATSLERKLESLGQGGYQRIEISGEVGRIDWGERDKGDPVSKALDLTGGGSYRQAGFTHPSWPEKGNQTGLGCGQ